MAKELTSPDTDVERAMHKRKKGTLKSGPSGKTVRSKKQAVAIGLSEARAKGKRCPRKRRPNVAAFGHSFHLIKP